MSDFDDEIISEFLVEGRESLDQLDRDLVQLEEDSADRGTLDRIFRHIHTLKGTCGFMGFSNLEALAHVGENLLSKLRDGEFDVTPDIITALLKTVDAIREMMDTIDETGSDGTNEYADLKAELTRLLAGPGAAAAAEPVAEAAPEPAPEPEPVVEAAPEPAPEPEPVVEVAPEPEPAPTPASSGGVDSIKAALLAELGLDDSEISAVLSGEDVTETASAAPAPAPEPEPAPEPAPAPQVNVNDLSGDPSALADAILAGTLGHVGGAMELDAKPDEPIDVNAAVSALLSETMQQIPGTEEKKKNVTAKAQDDAEQVMAAPPPKKEKKGKPAESGQRKARAHENIRVDVTLLDTLMNLVGELVLIRNQIVQCTQSKEDTVLTAATQRLNLVTSDLQEGVMKTRMQPIGNVWSKFPRVVRDLAITCGKRVRVEMVGKETELDKSLIEAIKDPLTHLVRNSVDHGIEYPGVREEKGKNGEGLLQLRAYHEGGKVNIEIRDDGGGIPPARIKQKAIEKGLITEEQGEGMTDHEIVNLIFTPGFSTAEKITNVSGRGVGMDVVRSNIERIGGAIEVQSTEGQGTTFRIKIPLTLAIVPALIVGSGNGRYAIPQVALQELVRLDADEAKKSVEFIQGTPVYRLRGRLLPLVFLSDTLGHARQEDVLNGRGRSMRIAVLQADDRQFGMVVDSIQDTQDIVVKPLSKHLKAMSIYAGATIMGDGQVALILDVLGIAQRGNVLKALRSRAAEDQVEDNMNDAGERTKLLLVRSPDDGRQAVPLAMVARLEEVEADKVEHVGSQRVVQYRGEILPLVFVSDVLPERRSMYRSEDDSAAQRLLNVVVYTENGRSIGLVVDQILDVVETRLDELQPGSRHGVTGCLVVRDKVTELLDVRAIIRAAEPSFFDAVQQPTHSTYRESGMAMEM
ncbi:MAG: chemotaxis protein CheW [Bradymonadia bacterium]